MGVNFLPITGGGVFTGRYTRGNICFITNLRYIYQLVVDSFMFSSGPIGGVMGFCFLFGSTYFIFKSTLGWFRFCSPCVWFITGLDLPPLWCIHNALLTVQRNDSWLGRCTTSRASSVREIGPPSIPAEMALSSDSTSVPRASVVG